MSRSFHLCSSGVGIRMTEPLFVAPSLSGIAPHMVFSQNLPSIACVHVLDPQPGETILDMCAAPGMVIICKLIFNTAFLVSTSVYVMFWEFGQMLQN